MLRLPPHQSTFTIASFDPGTHFVGMGALHVDMRSLRLDSYEATTLVATKLMDDEDLLVHSHGHTFARVTALSDSITRRLTILRPSFVVCEDAFFNRLRPGAFEPLLQSINAIRSAIYNYDPFMPFRLIPASVIKNAVGAKGGADKVSVLEGIKKIVEFQEASTRTPLHKLSEHAIDSLAIGYAGLTLMR